MMVRHETRNPAVDEALNRAEKDKGAPLKPWERELVEEITWLGQLFLWRSFSRASDNPPFH